MIYLFDKDEKLIKIIRKPAIKAALQKYSLTKERYVSDRLTVEMKALNDDELEKVEYMAIQTMEDAHKFHYFYVAQKSSDQLTTLIGVQSGIEELRKSPVFDKRPQNALAREVIDDLLSGTNWQARFVGETTPHSTNFYYISVFDALKKVCEVWDLEMQFFVEMNGNRIGARYIDFKRKIGQELGKRVVYGHNALQILQEVERTNIFTALIGRGKGEQVSSAEDSGKQANGFGRKITFEDVVWSTASGKPVNKPKGQKYVELPAMTKLYGIKNADGSMRPKIGFVDFAEEENPEQLLERTYKALVNAARPQLALKTSSVYLRGAKIGDTIRVVRHDKRLDYDTRIFDITFNRLNDQSSDIKLGDRIGESNEAKAQTIADKAIDEFVANEFTNFVKNLPDYLPTADGFNNNWYGAEDPTREHPGKVLINDIWYKPDPEHEGHKIMLRWTGEVWEELLRTFSSEALRAKISDEIEKLNKAMKASDLDLKEQTAQALRTAGTNASAIEAAKGAITKLNQDLASAKQTNQAAIDRLKSDFASAQRTANDQTALLRSDLVNIRTQQTQSESEIAKQVQALNAAKNELAGVKSAQATFEQSTTRRLAELTNLADGKASKSELVQTAQELSSRIASVQVGGRNLMGVFNTTPVKASFGAETYRFEAKTTKNTTRPTLQLQFRWTDGTYSAVVWVGQEGVFKKSFKITKPYSELRIKFNCNKEDATLLFKGDKIVELDTDYLFTGNLLNLSPNDSVADFLKIEKGTLPSDWSKAPEDTDGQISAVESRFKQRADSLEAGVNRLTEGLNTKADSSALTVLSDRIQASVKSLETDVQNKLDSKLSTAEFDVRASGIRQEILNATKDKADKTLVTAEAGQLREELASQVGSGRNLWINSKIAGNPVVETLPAGHITGQKQCYKLTNNQELSFNIEPDFSSRLFRKVTFSAWVKYENVVRGANNWNMFNCFRHYMFLKNSKTGTVSGVSFLTLAGYDGTSDWKRIVFTYDYSANKGYDQLKTILKFNLGSVISGTAWITGIQVEFGDVANEYAPALEDVDSLITEAKATFERTAQGLRTDLTAVQAYVNADGTRSEALCTFSREETARQITAERKLIEAGYVGKSAYTEDVRSISKRFEELKNSSETKLAEYRQTVEGQFTTITQQVAGKASQTEFQRVQETSKLYERLIGSTESDVVSKVSKMVMSNSLFQVEVSKNEGLKTVQTQLAGSWAVKNLNSAGDLISGLNLGANGVNRLDGRLTHITGQTLIDNAVIKSAMIESMLADKITAGTLNAANVNIVNLNANKLVGLDANFIKSKIELAFIEWMKGKVISAQNDAMQINLNDGHVLFYNDDASIKRVLEGYPTQFIRYENKVENGQNHGRTIIGSNRNGTNAWKSVSFAGLVIDNNSNNSVDKIYQFGDYNHLRHAQGDDGWDFSVVTQAMTPGVWNKNSEIWARHFVVPRETRSDTDTPTKFIRLEESVAAIWNILTHAASGQVTMTQAMKNLINSRKAAWDIVRNVG